LLVDAGLMETSIKAAISACGATLMQYRSQRFDGGGLTAFAMLAESHISSHTWPEHGFAAFDIFTCGSTTDPHRARQVLEQYYQPLRIEVRDIVRGEAASGR
jgi:S-adenosylmethionine decarboxylase